MPNEKSEKIKLYFVIGLVCVALVVAYFRFFRQKDVPAAPSVVGAKETPKKVVSYPIARSARTAMGSIDAPKLLGKTPAVDRIRDIFERPDIPVEPEKPVKAAVTGTVSAPTIQPEDILLELKGTILQGNRPMAIINGQFIRLGETIEMFTVIHITANEVLLRAGQFEKTLQVLKMQKGLGL